MTPSRQVHPLIGAIAGGDTRAFAELYRLSSPKLHGVVLRVLRQQELAGSALRRAYARIGTEAGRLSPREDGVAFLVARARAATFDVARAHPGLDAWEPFEVAEPATDPLALPARSPALTRLLACLGTLTEERRRMLLLAYYDGWSVDAISVVFDAPSAVVRAMIARSTAQIAECLARKASRPGGKPAAGSGDADQTLAAEYALGTLSGTERGLLAARLESEPDLAALVRRWERRLAPLHELAAPVTPPPELGQLIAADFAADFKARQRRSRRGALSTAPGKGEPKPGTATAAPGRPMAEAAGILARMFGRSASRAATPAAGRRRPSWGSATPGGGASADGMAQSMAAIMPASLLPVPEQVTPPLPMTLIAAGDMAARNEASAAVPAVPAKIPPARARSGRAPAGSPVQVPAAPASGAKMPASAAAPRAPLKPRPKTSPPLTPEARLAAFRTLSEAIDLRIGNLPLLAPQEEAAAPEAEAPSIPSAPSVEPGAATARDGEGAPSAEPAPGLSSGPADAAAALPAGPPQIAAAAAGDPPAQPPPSPIALMASGQEAEAEATASTALPVTTPAAMPVLPDAAPVVGASAEASDIVGPSGLAPVVSDAVSGPEAALSVVPPPAVALSRIAGEAGPAAPPTDAPEAAPKAIAETRPAPLPPSPAAGSSALAAPATLSHAPQTDRSAGSPPGGPAAAMPVSEAIPDRPALVPPDPLPAAGAPPALAATAVLSHSARRSPDGPASAVFLPEPVPARPASCESALQPSAAGPSTLAATLAHPPPTERAASLPPGGPASAAPLPEALPEAPALSVPAALAGAMEQVGADAAPDPEPAAPVVRDTSAPLPAPLSDEAVPAISEPGEAIEAAALSAAPAGADAGGATAEAPPAAAPVRPVALPPPVFRSAASPEPRGRPHQPTVGIGRRVPLAHGLRRVAASPVLVAGLGVALVALAGAFAWREWTHARGAPVLSVLQPAPAPTVMVRIDPPTGGVKVRVIEAEPPAGARYALWLVTPNGGSHLLARFSGSADVVSPALRRLDRATLAASSLNVTLEPSEAATGVGAAVPEVIYRGRLITD